MTTLAVACFFAVLLLVLIACWSRAHKRANRAEDAGTEAVNGLSQAEEALTEAAAALREAARAINALDAQVSRLTDDREWQSVYTAVHHERHCCLPTLDGIRAASSAR